MIGSGDRGKREIDAATNGERPEQPSLLAGSDEASQEQWAEGGADADGGEEHSEAARADFEPTVGEHHEQAAGGARRHRCEYLHDREPGEQRVRSHRSDAVERPGPAAHGRISWRAPGVKSDEQQGRGGERGCVERERDSDAEA